MVGKNQPSLVKKKKNVAKHVLAAQSRRVDATSATATGETTTDSLAASSSSSTSSASVSSSSSSSKNKNKHTKPPSEASNYLILWSLSRSDWRFNKNTQSWLLRHMYNDVLVSKSAFKLLLEYVKTIKGKGKDNVLKEAVLHAKKYKEWEKKTDGTADADDEAKSKKKRTTKKGQNEEGEEGGGDKDDEEEDDEVHFDGNNWEAISPKRKRKVYKRARGVHDALKDGGSN